MLPVHASLVFQPTRFARIVLAYQQRSLANLSSSPPKPSSSDPPLIKDMPKLLIPKGYEGLIDVKQEPGFVIINGRRYPYPYPGIYGEYNYLELLEKWRKEGKVNADNVPIFRKMKKGRERTLAGQLWFQRDPSIPVHKLGPHDQLVNALITVMMFYASLYGFYISYRVVVPKDQDIFNGDNWVRWHKESKH